MFALARSIEGKDPYTEGHCERLARYSARLGKHLGLSSQQIKALRQAGVVHDIGKVAVPDSILLKPGPLTPEERHIVQRHSIVGEGICAPLKSFQLVLPIIRHHHEKMNGTGYPDGLKGEEIPLTARVLQIVDVYDALTTTRPYKSALGVSEASIILFVASPSDAMHAFGGISIPAAVLMVRGWPQARSWLRISSLRRARSVAAD